MRSIRVSLVAYFLVLLALGLGAFAFFMHESSRERLAGIYRANHATLGGQTRQTQAHFQESYQLTEQTLRANFDEKLLGKAQSLANHLTKQGRSYWEWDSHVRPGARVLGALASQSHALQGPLAAMFSAHYQEFGRREISSYLTRTTKLATGELQFVEEVIPTPDGMQSAGMFQIYNDQGDSLLTSPALGLETLKLDDLDWHLPLFKWSFDDVVLPGNKPARVVTLKAPVVRMRVVQEWFEPRRPRGTPPVRHRRTVLVPINTEETERDEAPIVFIQYARSTDEVDVTLNELRADVDRKQNRLLREHEENLKSLDEQSQASLATLRTRLLLISLLTFAVTVLGGIWLVHRVLKPVQRISEAVSEVTEKDFQLRLERKDVPEELAPIVERLKLSLASLSQAFTREKQAAADISHELRTPISALLATTQVCLRKDRTTEEYRSALQNCKDIGQQLSLLVERLLTLARLDAGADKLRPEAVDVPDLAEQCVQMVRPLAESRDVALQFQLNSGSDTPVCQQPGRSARPTPLVVQTDPDKLREVLNNLLHNAIQYNRPQGRIDVAVGQNNGHVEVSVRDTGIGIAPEAKARLFERFYRADPSRQSDTVQAGLGLAIVKGYLDLMGAKIEVDSIEGQGTTFRVLLPVTA